MTRAARMATAMSSLRRVMVPLPAAALAVLTCMGLAWMTAGARGFVTVCDSTQIGVHELDRFAPGCRFHRRRVVLPFLAEEGVARSREHRQQVTLLGIRQGLGHAGMLLAGDALVLRAVAQVHRGLHLGGLADGRGASELVLLHAGGDGAAVEAQRRLQAAGEAAVGEESQPPA